MNTRWWTKEEIERMLDHYERGYPSKDIAQMLGRTESSVRYKLFSLGFSTRRLVCDPVESCPAPVVAEVSEPPPHVPEDSLHYELRARRELELGDQRKQERERIESAKREILEEKIVEEFRRTLFDLPRGFAFSPPPPVPKVAEALTAVLVISDVHIGQVVDPRETEGLGSYNPAIALARIRHLELEVIRILGGRTVERLLVLFAGDILHGHLGHSLEDDLTLPIALQADLAVNFFFPCILGLSRVVPSIEIHGVAGNHGRWPGLRKMPSDRRWSNLDSIVYGSLGALCRHAGLSNVEWDERVSSRRQIEAGKFRLQLLHGDEVRGGNFCSGGMNREVHNSTLRNVQAGRDPIDYFVMGDKHFSASVPYGSGCFIVNGSFVGVDAFGMNFLPAPPAQTLFFLHPVLGKTETHEIRLAHGRLSSPPPYELKPNLLEVIQRYE